MLSNIFFFEPQHTVSTKNASSTAHESANESHTMCLWTPSSISAVLTERVLRPERQTTAHLEKDSGMETHATELKNENDVKVLLIGSLTVGCKTSLFSLTLPSRNRFVPRLRSFSPTGRRNHHLQGMRSPQTESSQYNRETDESVTLEGARTPQNQCTR